MPYESMSCSHGNKHKSVKCKSVDEGWGQRGCKRECVCKWAAAITAAENHPLFDARAMHDTTVPGWATRLVACHRKASITHISLGKGATGLSSPETLPLQRQALSFIFLAAAAAPPGQTLVLMFVLFEYRSDLADFMVNSTPHDHWCWCWSGWSLWTVQARC